MNEVIVYGGALAVLAVIAVSLMRVAQGAIHYAPSLGWACIMALPFLFEFSLIHPDTRMLQGGIILWVMALIFALDTFADRHIKDMPADSTVCSLRLAYMMAAGYLGITVFHLATVNSIPLISVFTDNLTNFGEDPAMRALVDEGRLQFSRNYTFMPFLKYVFTLSTPLLGVPAALLLWSQKRRATAALLFCWIISYCVLSTAKGPFILALIMILISVLHFSKNPQRQNMGRFFVVIGCIGLMGLVGMTSGHPNKGSVLSNLKAKFETPHPLREGRTFMLGDYVRSQRDTTVTQSTCIKLYPCRKANYIVYRIFLTPVEVSARWYEYFTTFPVTDVSYSRLINDSRSGERKHPAQAVAQWAFAEPFPHEYSNIAFAYPSMDADAYGRYGLMGLLIVAFMYSVMRVGSILFHDLRAPTRGVYYTVMTGLLTMLPANASIQAMVLAHGVAPILMVMFAIFACTHYDAIVAAYRSLRAKAA